MAVGWTARTSALDLALGSALATIGLTIPAVAAVPIVLGYRLELGLDAKEQGLLALTLLLGVITLAAGWTTVLQGMLHLAMRSCFLPWCRERLRRSCAQWDLSPTTLRH